MKVLRRVEVRTEQYVIGDQIELKVNGFDKTYTATCHQVRCDTAFFLLDDYINEGVMNENGKNIGGFENSDLNRWLQEVLFTAFPKKIRNRMIGGLTIPSYGMMFGHDEKYQSLCEERDDDEQLPLMKIRSNRVAYCKDAAEWGWLRNSRKNSDSIFLAVSGVGEPSTAHALVSIGVRVGFWLQMDIK